MQRINEVNEFKTNQTILFLDSNGGVRGIDKMIEIDYKTGVCKYLNSEEKIFNGNLLI